MVLVVDCRTDSAGYRHDGRHFQDGRQRRADVDGSLSCRLVNVRVQISRQNPTHVTDRQTLKLGDRVTVAELSGVLEETTEQEREALCGLDGSPDMRFIAYGSWLVRTRDRLKVLDVMWRHRPRFGHLGGAEYVVLSVVNSFRGGVAYLGAAQAEGV